MRLAGIVALAAGISAAQPVSFEKQVRPILSRHCVGCHQPAGRQADLSLAGYDDLLKGGRKGPALVAGKPDESLIIAYLTGKSTPQMPFGGKPLPPEQIELIRLWIAAGAPNDSREERLPPPTAPVVYHAPPVVTALAYSPDGKLLAVSGYREILLHEPAGALVARLPGLSERIHGLAFSPDGSVLAAVGGNPARFGEVQIWDVAARKLRHSTVLTNDTLSGVAFSPDGTRIAFGCADKSIRLFDVATGKELRRMDHHEDWVFATVFGVDGKRLVSVGRDRAAKLIDAATGAFLENVNLLREPLTAIARHPKRDWVLIGGAERIPYLYRMDRPRAMRIADDSTLIRKFDQQDAPITALAISPAGDRIAAAAEVGDARIYDLESGAPVAACSGHQGGIYTLAFDPVGRLAVAGFDGIVRIYASDGKLVRAFVPVPVEKAVTQK